LLGDFSKGLVELEIFAFDCEDSAEIRAPRQDVNVPVVAIKSPPEQTGQFDLLPSPPAKLFQTDGDGGVEFSPLYVICMPNPFPHRPGHCLGLGNLPTFEPHDNGAQGITYQSWCECDGWVFRRVDLNASTKLVSKTSATDRLGASAR
jgi:hypothetical protein